MLHLTTLGRCQVEPVRFPRGGLALLALVRIATTTRPVRRDTLIRALWQPDPLNRVQQRLRQLTFSLRRAYPELNLRVNGDMTQIDPCAIRIDWFAAEELGRGGHFVDALQLTKGLFLANCRFPTPAYEIWVDGVRAAQARQARSWIVRSLVSGDPRIAELQPAIVGLGSVAPGDPVVDLLRARILQWHGRRSAAKSLLDTCQRRLPPSCSAIAKSMRQELARARNNRIAAAERSAAPFVGRAAEIAVLQKIWRRTCTGKLSFCELSGEAGIGKTRLANQFARWVALQGGKTILIRGDKPFNETLEELLAGLAVHAPAQPAGTTAARYWADSVEVVLNSIAAIAARQPLLLSIDDYQLIDGALRQLVHTIAVRMRGKPLLIVIVARSPRDMPQIAADSLVVRLGHLSDTEARQLVSASSDRPLTQDVTDAILARSTNSPLALLAWTRLIGQEWDVNVQAQMLASTAPSTLLHDLVQRRSPAARTILRCLSLIRPAYPLRALLAVTGICRAELEGELEGLVAEGLVNWGADGVQLAHALYRLNSAAALENEPATLKHRMIALSLTSCGSRYSAEIARQLALAGDHRESIKYYVRGARAAVRSANRSDAEECIAEAMRLCRTYKVPDGHVQLAAASMHYQWEEYGFAAPRFRQALKSSLHLTRRRALEAKIRYMRSAILGGLLKPSSGALRALLRRARHSGDTEMEIEAAYTVLHALPYGATRDGFRQLAQDFREISARAADERAGVRALSQAALLYFAGSLPRIGTRFGLEALRRARDLEDDHSVVEVCGGLGAIQMGRGDLRDAGLTFEIGREALARLGYTPRRQLWFTNFGVYLLETGRWTEAERVFEEGLQQNQQAGTDATLNAHVRLNFALLYYEWGRYDDVSRYAEEFLHVNLRASAELTAGVALVGLIALERGDRQTADAVAGRLQNVTNFFGDESYHHMLLARILASDQQVDSARNLLTNAYSRLRRRYYPAAARVQLELLRLTEPTASSRLLAFAADCEGRGLMPIAERARS